MLLSILLDNLFKVESCFLVLLFFEIELSQSKQLHFLLVRQLIRTKIFCCVERRNR